MAHSVKECVCLHRTFRGEGVITEHLSQKMWIYVEAHIYKTANAFVPPKLDMQHISVMKPLRFAWTDPFCCLRIDKASADKCIMHICASCNSCWFLLYRLGGQKQDECFVRSDHETEAQITRITICL